MKDNHVLGKYTAPAAPVQGETICSWCGLAVNYPGAANAEPKTQSAARERTLARPNRELDSPDRGQELVAAYQRIDELKASLTEMVGIYWGEGDGIHPPPACIQRAMAALNDEVAALEPFPAESGV